MQHDKDQDNGVRTLTPADIHRLNTRDHPRLEEGDAEAMVIQAPGLSKWHPESGEFILVTPWRHRRDIPSIAINSAFRHEDALIEAAIESATEQDAAAFIMLETYESRRPVFYTRNGMEKLEQIVTYEHAHPRAFLATMIERRQRFVRLDRQNAALGQQVLEVDHAAFPWLWWNSPEEFSSYLALPNIDVWAGVVDDNVVSYVGFTHYRHWSHLDRIAIRPDVQRRGYGREALHFAVELMVARGAMRVALSTQSTNPASRRLYESVGFHPTPDHDYNVYGVILPAGRRMMDENR
ncbi:MAG TPA: GNAT family N-acetyltransferase [Thermomicrobiales bacterium]|nr:GNAT family N-acetyltransferase [Thermomicrobiales bacterium]